MINGNKYCSLIDEIYFSSKLFLYHTLHRYFDVIRIEKISKHYYFRVIISICNQLLLGNNLGPNNCIPNAPTGAVNKIDITAIVTSRVAHSTSSDVPNFLAISKATGARAACTKKKKKQFSN